MTDRDPLAAFDEDIVASVARETGTAVEHLRGALRRHQEHAALLPSVDDLVYEWRRFLPYDPLVRRDAETYVLALERSVWTEFGDQLSFDEPTLEAVVLVHARQARRALDSEATGSGSVSAQERNPEDAFADAEAMVLTR